MKITALSLVYGTSSLAEPLLTAIPKWLMKDPKTGLAVIAKQSVMFFLELNHDTLTIWYQIDQCHFAYTVESVVLSLN